MVAFVAIMVSHSGGYICKYTELITIIEVYLLEMTVQPYMLIWDFAYKYRFRDKVIIK